MMPHDLPRPIVAYIEARNAFDVDALLEPFDEDAVVSDEDQAHRGRPAIRAWIEDTTRKYRASVEVKDVRQSGGKTIVSGLVTGSFPGSPILLDHTFTLSGGKIARLEIG